MDLLLFVFQFVNVFNALRYIFRLFFSIRKIKKNVFNKSRNILESNLSQQQKGKSNCCNSEQHPGR